MNYAQNEPQRVIPAIGGQILFHQNDTDAAYLILSGEVIIIRNGQVIDLVEEGELLDPQMWQGATAIAWTQCMFEAAGQATALRRQVPTFAPATAHDKQLALAA